jgi:hypothetical protein
MEEQEQEETSQFVIPTRRWTNQTIRTPWDGPIHRTGTLPILVPKRAANWLIKYCFAKPYVEGAEQAAPVSPMGSPEVPQPVDDSAILNHPTVEDAETPPPDPELLQQPGTVILPETWQSECVRRLGEMDGDAIAQIKGISGPMAELIASSKPLDWEKLSKIINERQSRSLQVWIEGQGQG